MAAALIWLAAILAIPLAGWAFRAWFAWKLDRVLWDTPAWRDVAVSHVRERAALDRWEIECVHYLEHGEDA